MLSFIPPPTVAAEEKSMMEPVKRKEGAAVEVPIEGEEDHLQARCCHADSIKKGGGKKGRERGRSTILRPEGEEGGGERREGGDHQVVSSPLG